MDVVRENIQAIGGSCALTSKPGQGSRFTLKIPLTLAIAPALIVEASGQRFALPQHSVVEAVGLNGGEHKIELCARLENPAIARRSVAYRQSGRTAASPGPGGARRRAGAAGGDHAGRRAILRDHGGRGDRCSGNRGQAIGRVDFASHDFLRPYHSRRRLGGADPRSQRRVPVARSRTIARKRSRQRRDPANGAVRQDAAGAFPRRFGRGQGAALVQHRAHRNGQRRAHRIFNRHDADASSGPLDADRGGGAGCDGPRRRQHRLRHFAPWRAFRPAGGQHRGHRRTPARCRNRRRRARA